LEIAAKHNVFTLEEKGAPAMLSRQLFRAAEITRTFNYFPSTYEDDLAHILLISEAEGEILGLQLRMTIRNGNRHAAEL
jgi:hypothetical protein